MSSTQTLNATLLHVDISVSPLIAGDAQSLLAATISAHMPPSPTPTACATPIVRRDASLASLATLSTISLGAIPPLSHPIPPSSIIGLLDFLKRMDNDVANEVNRVRILLEEARATVQEAREELTTRPRDIEPQEETP
ncbi:hypothetical protein CERSUDRAFT_94475 [Gelatoporia subvermispora B]|uniref:Uncharacterized protein n=1 Tax=Ceriporiopsis subvermispora (strain B) TaxID=914234 RepID=M2RG98_CERS8|nr:hypothetical protein CERSUDRAFT_94475 [Gelatoporia subvermispora B]